MKPPALPTPFPPSWYGAKPLLGIHDEDQRFPYAALADELSAADRDGFAEKTRAAPLWADRGREVARRVAGGQTH